MNHKKQELNIPAGWEIKRNEFYDIDPFDNSSADEKDTLIFAQEDMLWIQKRNYQIDLGWYGGHALNDRGTGFCIHLIRGENWNKCELLEKFRSKNKKDIVEKLVSIIASVEKGDYISLQGYKIDEGDLSNKNSMSDHEVYSVQKMKRNPMHAGDPVVGETLRMEWEAIVSIFASDGMPSPIKTLIRYMISQGYDEIFVPGSSLFTLLVSVPIDNKVNYSYTLRVEYDERIQIIKFKFLERVPDLKQGYSDDVRLTRWEETCQASEGAVILEEFLNSSDIFKEAITRHRRCR